MTGGYLVYLGIVTEHYFSPSDLPEPEDLRLLQISTRGHDLQMWVTGQVFSTTRLDPGTRELLHALPELPTSGNILDLGCGWGPLAVVAAMESPESTVWAVDVNPRALDLTARNASANLAANVETLLADVALERAAVEGIRFDAIISNPPVRVGKAALHDMLAQWLPLLSENGTAWLVVGKNLGADSLLRWLRQKGWDAQKFSSRKGYRIITVRRGR